MKIPVLINYECLSHHCCHRRLVRVNRQRLNLNKPLTGMWLSITISNVLVMRANTHMAKSGDPPEIAATTSSPPNIPVSLLWNTKSIIIIAYYHDVIASARIILSIIPPLSPHCLPIISGDFSGPLVLCGGAEGHDSRNPNGFYGYTGYGESPRT